MSWRIDQSDAGQFLHLIATGPISTEDVHAQVKEGVEVILREDLPGALIDYSGAVLEMPVVEIFKVPDMFDALGLPHPTRIAVVLPPDPVNMHKYTFFDDTATNRGFQVKLCWERTAALDWLAEAVEDRRRQGEPGDATVY